MDCNFSGTRQRRDVEHEEWTLGTAIPGPAVLSARPFACHPDSLGRVTTSIKPSALWKSHRQTILMLQCISSWIHYILLTSHHLINCEEEKINWLHCFFMIQHLFWRLRWGHTDWIFHISDWSYWVMDFCFVRQLEYVYVFTKSPTVLHEWKYFLVYKLRRSNVLVSLTLETMIVVLIFE